MRLWLTYTAPLLCNRRPLPACTSGNCAACTTGNPLSCATCGYGYYLNGADCAACPSATCMTCSSSACTSCYAGSRLNGNVCGERRQRLRAGAARTHSVQDADDAMLSWLLPHSCSPSVSPAEACPARTFAASSTATTCTNCATGCAACTSASTCTQCDANYIMNNGVCGEWERRYR